eukprot:m.287049 g.287049  ORF g.287049 m.287049 type:complete len:89 (-) comp11695_c0_seq1:503-769(-)
MPYISNSTVQSHRSPWRLSRLPELFWAIINFFLLFFKTMMPGGAAKNNSTEDVYRARDRGDYGGGGPRRRMGGFRSNSGANAPPMGGG